MNLKQARETAAQIYCEYEHKEKVLDPTICESIARILVRETSNKGAYERALERLRENPGLFSIMPTAFVVGRLKNPDDRFMAVAEQILKTVFEVADDPKPQTP